jgi:DNA-3-methyladenine glycosylase I
MDYHDNVWGVPEYDDQKLFEFLNLEGAQAGLSWYTVLIKKDNYRKAFSDWDPKKIVKYNDKKVQSLLADPGIIRNKLKVNAVITNAKVYLDLKDSGTTLSDYLWNYTDGKPIVNHWKDMSEVPASTDLSQQISKDMKKLGFKFVGPTIIYAFMQAVGMVDDHLITCWKRN